MTAGHMPEMPEETERAGGGQVRESRFASVNEVGWRALNSSCGVLRECLRWSGIQRASLDELGNQWQSRSEVKGSGRKEEKLTPMLWVSQLVAHGSEQMGGRLLEIVYEARSRFGFSGSGASMGDILLH